MSVSNKTLTYQFHVKICFEIRNLWTFFFNDPILYVFFGHHSGCCATNANGNKCKQVFHFKIEVTENITLTMCSQEQNNEKYLQF
jgi:hypothetical protein